MTSAIAAAQEVVERRGELGARVEVEVVTAREHVQRGARHDARQSIASGAARRAIAVDRAQRRLEACELGVVEIRLGGEIREQRRLACEEVERRDQTRGLAAAA